MVECPIPQDILKYKPKFIASLSVRETVCGGLGVGLGLLSYFSWTKNIESTDMRMLISFLVIMPFFLIGFVKLYDQPFEKIAVTLVMENFIYPPKRKKEVHFPEFERYEKTREWLLEEDPVSIEGGVLDEFASLEEDEESSARNSKKGKKKTTKKTSQKITVKKSSTYKGIK